MQHAILAHYSDCLAFAHRHTLYIKYSLRYYSLEGICDMYSVLSILKGDPAIAVEKIVVAPLHTKQ